MIRWYVVQTMAGQERSAAKEVAKLPVPNIETWVATFVRTVRNGRRQDEVIRPLFPLYFFARFDASPDARSGWGRIMRVRGVWTILGINRPNGAPISLAKATSDLGRNAWPVPLPDRVVVALQDAAAAGGGHISLDTVDPTLPRLKKGGTVLITDGPFAGFFGLVDRDQKERVRVLLDIWGRETPIVLPRESLSAKR